MTAIEPAFPTPENEALRLNKLYDYQILDTHPEDTFDKIAMLASQVFDAPCAFITFIDHDRVFFKANISSFEGNVAARDAAPCTHAILKDDFTIIYDALEHQWMRESPLVNCRGGIRFYAATPLKTPEGYLLGTLCVADTRPREVPVTTKQLDMLKMLSDLVINKLESRLRYKSLLKSQNDLMNLTLHEIKNPLASINLANDVLKKDPSKLENMSAMIKQSFNRIQSKLSDLLKQSEQEEEQLKLNIEETDLKELLASLLKNFELQAQRKRQAIHLDYDSTVPAIFIDRAKISDVFHNLLSNALKYSYYDSNIHIIVKKDTNAVSIEFRDQGQGLDRDDVSRLFMKFAKLSSRPTGKESSNGLGLSICKSFVELHRGKIFAKSEGKNHGSSFFVLLPFTHEVETD